MDSSLVVQRESDDYQDNYVRRQAGPIRIRLGDSDKTTKIGEIEAWYIDGSRAADDSLDIADVCDSLGQVESDYAAAVYTDRSIDPAIIEDPVSNDVLVIHSLTLQAKYHGQKLETHIIRKIARTVGYHCAAVVLIPKRVGITDSDELELVPTKNPSILCLTSF